MAVNILTEQSGSLSFIAGCYKSLKWYFPRENGLLRNNQRLESFQKDCIFPVILGQFFN